MSFQSFPFFLVFFFPFTTLFLCLHLYTWWCEKPPFPLCSLCWTCGNIHKDVFPVQNSAWPSVSQVCNCHRCSSPPSPHSLLFSSLLSITAPHVDYVTKISGCNLALACFLLIWKSNNIFVKTFFNSNCLFLNIQFEYSA